MPGQTRTSHADDAQHNESDTLLNKAVEAHCDSYKACDRAVCAAVSLAEGPQQQQLRGFDQQSDHGAYFVDDGVDQAAEEYENALLRSFKQLTSLVWGNGHVCMLLAAFIFSLSVLCVKLTGSRVPVVQITLARSFLSFIISTVLIKARGIKPMFGQRKHAVWLIGRGVSGALAMMTFYVAILKLPLADANTLFFLNPCMTAVAAWMFLGESLGILGAAGCVLSLLGLVLLTHPPMLFGGHADWGPQRVWGTMFGVASAVAATGAFICIRFVGKAEPAIVVALYFHTSTMVLSAIPLTLGFPQPAAWVSLTDALLLLGVAATSFFGQLSLTRGFQLLNASKAAGLNFSQVVWGYIFGITLFGEELTLFGVLGTLLIAVGMGCVTARSTSAEKNQNAIKTNEFVRDQAAAGFGSVLLPRQQQQQQDQSSSSYIARFASFQRLLARRHDGDHAAAAAAAEDENASNGEMASVGQCGHDAASGDIVKFDLGDHSTIYKAQQQYAANQSMLVKQSVARDHTPIVIPAAASGGSSPPVNVDPSSFSRGDTELVPLGHIQHRHVGYHHQQQQQQQHGSQAVYNQHQLQQQCAAHDSVEPVDKAPGVIKHRGLSSGGNGHDNVSGRQHDSSVMKYSNAGGGDYVDLDSAMVVVDAAVPGHTGGSHGGQHGDAFVEIPLGLTRL